VGRVTVKSWPLVVAIPSDATVQPSFCGLAALPYVDSAKPSFGVPVNTPVFFTASGTGFYPGDSSEQHWPVGATASPSVDLVQVGGLSSLIVVSPDPAKAYIVVSVAPSASSSPCDGSGYVVTASRGTVQYLEDTFAFPTTPATATIGFPGRTTSFVVSDIPPGAPISITGTRASPACTLSFSAILSADPLTTGKFPAVAGHVSHVTMYQRQ
jgi:hypothetical protein